MITNKRQLIANGVTPLTKKARRLVLEGVEFALTSADPNNFLQKHITFNGKVLSIDNRRFNLDSYKRIFVVGAGKASGRMAEYIESLLKERITDGFVNILKGTEKNFKTSKIFLNEANHPIPDEKGLNGARRIHSLVQDADRSDLVISLISGGGSALMTLPKEGGSLKDIQDVTQKLILSGADIHEINTVRKHLSQIKGGLLSKSAYPATTLSLILSDVIGDDLNIIASGPTVPDNSTYSDAINVLKKYTLWNQIPQNVRHILEKGFNGTIEETPKPGDPYFKKTYNFIIGSNREICKDLKRFYRRKGLRSIFLTSTLEGEARLAGYFLSAITNEVLISKNPLPKPCAIICGGETTVTVKGRGVGGRNQEVMLAALSNLHHGDGVALVSFGTDGLDGPTEAAGALVDGFSHRRSVKSRLDFKRSLDDNDSYHFFKKMGDLVISGPTGTNVNDISIIVAL